MAKTISFIDHYICCKCGDVFVEKRKVYLPGMDSLCLGCKLGKKVPKKEKPKDLIAMKDDEKDDRQLELF